MTKVVGDEQQGTNNGTAASVQQPSASTDLLPRRHCLGGTLKRCTRGARRTLAAEVRVGTILKHTKSALENGVFLKMDPNFVFVVTMILSLKGLFRTSWIQSGAGPLRKPLRKQEPTSKEEPTSISATQFITELVKSLDSTAESASFSTQTSGHQWAVLAEG